MRYARFALFLGVLAAVALVLSGAGASPGTTERVSVASDGTQGNGNSSEPAISPDGRHVAFESFASNLVPGDTNDVCGSPPYEYNCPDVFIHDRQTGTTARVSIASSADQGNGESWWPAIAADGRYVAFQSNATNLIPADTNGVSDVFVHDRDTDEDGIFDEPDAISTVRVSVDSAGNEGNGDSERPVMSADGRFVAFTSYASNLVPSDNNGYKDVFVHDRDVDNDGVFDEPGSIVTTRVSVDTAGNEGNASSGHALALGISADGRFIAFDSLASNLVSGDGPAGDAFVRDRDTDGDGIFDEPGSVSTELVSVDSDGVPQIGDIKLLGIDISGDGRFVVFCSNASNLVPNDTNGVTDVFVHDRLTGDTMRVSVDSSGNEANGSAGLPCGLAASGDGRFVTFHSNASNLVVGDTNGVQDAFVHDLGPCVTAPWTVPPDDGDCDGFTDAEETVVGTDPADPCPDTPDPNDEADDKWPPDWDDSQTVDLLDLLPFKNAYWGAYDPRFDLNMDAAINILDLLPFKPFFNLSCT